MIYLWNLVLFYSNSYKGNSLKASYYHSLDSKLWKNMNVIQRALASLSITAVAAKASHKFLTNENVITIGTQFALTRSTTLKARVNNVGNASAVIRSKCNQMSFIVISGEVNTEAADPTPKFGVAFSTKSWVALYAAYFVFGFNKGGHEEWCIVMFR